MKVIRCPRSLACARRLIELADPKPGERVLDVGCGTGIVARNVAELLGSKGTVTGIDVNPNMLAVARAVANQNRLKIDWRQGECGTAPIF